jgi:hypothetical protein
MESFSQPTTSADPALKVQSEFDPDISSRVPKHATWHFSEPVKDKHMCSVSQSHFCTATRNNSCKAPVGFMPEGFYNRNAPGTQFSHV